MLLFGFESDMWNSKSYNLKNVKSDHVELKTYVKSM